MPPTIRNPVTRRKPYFPRACFDPVDVHEYTPEQLDFCIALDRFKREARRPHPTNREVLAVLRSLGYRIVAEAVPVTGPATAARQDREPAHASSSR